MLKFKCIYMLVRCCGRFQGSFVGRQDRLRKRGVGGIQGTGDLFSLH